MYFENKKSLYDEMPDNLRGKLIKRKGVIDFMDFTPSCISLVAVVSHKIKQIFDRLNVSEDEYVLKKYLSKIMMKSSIFSTLTTTYLPPKELPSAICHRDENYMA